MDEMQETNETIISFGSEFKSLGDGKFGGYLVRFTTPKDPDLTGDFFTKSTEFGVKDGADLPLFYNHGLDGTLKTRRIGSARVKFDDVGLWLDAQLESRDEYEKAIAQMAESGKMGLSSGAAGHLVEREQVGKAFWLKTWIIAEGSLTPTPAEPRNTVISLKSYMGANEPEPETPAQTETAVTPSEPGKSTINNGVIKMEIDEIKLQEMLDTASEKAVKNFVAAQPSAVTPDIQVVSDEADRALAGNPFKSAQEFFVAVKNAGVYPSETDKRLLPLKATGLNEAIPSQGGFLVPQQTAGGIQIGRAHV
jgi:phage head maturation protease